ncbi:EamA family transporter [Paenibacillus hexagrammi]|uniref:EamA family transporter n=1 Tax=Paenibacillus hexagrammi TaxID=2908839 RepID=A0ABY3SMT3_9BACL|nr:EamA family transporter [Paenibacillus sp. YPD9-1]UJF35208.1 EamA family transporter [Paenibacillus sp. YPD9-1]
MAISPLLLVGINVMLLVAGQILWKLALTRTPLNGWDSLGSVLVQPYLLLGCLLYGAATLLWFYALSRFDLSRVYPLQSFAYVLGALCGLLVFKETLTTSQWMGLFLLVGGAFMLAK